MHAKVAKVSTIDNTYTKILRKLFVKIFDQRVAGALEMSNLPKVIASISTALLLSVVLILAPPTHATSSPQALHHATVTEALFHTDAMPLHRMSRLKRVARRMAAPMAARMASDRAEAESRPAVESSESDASSDGHSSQTRLIVRTTTMTMTATNLAEFHRQVESVVAKTARGYVVSSSLSQDSQLSMSVRGE